MNAELLDQPPPAALDSEIALLAGFAEAKRINPDIYIRADQFCDHRNAAIFQAMLDLEGEHGTWDDPSLVDRLRRHPRWDKDGFDFGYSAEVFGTPGLPSMAAYHAGKIIEAWRRRSIGNAALDIFQASRNGFDTDELQRSLDRIKTTLDGDGDQPGVGQVVSRTLDTVHPAKTSWLWPGRIPRGKYSEFMGHPGTGKSVLLCSLMARVSSGQTCPDSDVPMGPGGVVFMGIEDDIADTVRPRLDSAGADCSRIRAVEAVGSIDPETGKRTLRSISLDRDVPAIEEAIKQTADCRLVVIDPITAFCGKTDSHKAAEVRALLSPLTELAAKHNVAVVGITHFNKGNGSQAIGRGMGSLAWIAAARMAWAVVKDDENPSNRLLLPIKCNLAKDATGLSYRIEDVDGVPVVRWSGEIITKTVDDVLGASQVRKQSPKRRDVKDWLRGKLAEGAAPANDILNADDGAEFGERLIRWAKKELRIRSYCEGFGRDGVWFWTLPEEEPE